MSELTELDDKLDKHASRVKEIGDEVRTLVESESAESKARLDEVKTEQKRITDEVGPLLVAKEQAELKANVADNQRKLEAIMASTRTAAKAVGAGRSPDRDPEYKAGSFLNAVASLNPAREGWSPESHAAAKAVLDGLSQREDAWGKATLGTSDAAGGWIIPNAIVDTLIKPATAKNIYRQICTVREGVTAFAVDIPFRSSQPARAVIAPFGSTKENVDVAYNGYTATMYTLARIHDLSNQFLRQSQGAAEADVLEELANAFALGEAYYIRQGTGTAMPYGLFTALTNAPAAFTSAFTASATTLAGSIASSIAVAAGALAGRSVTPTAAVLAGSQYWTMISQGTDTAGFFFAPAGGPNAINGVAPGTVMSPFGIPVYADNSIDQFAVEADIDALVVGDFKNLKLYFGENYRVDSSSVAGTRWDANVTGFRGEEEMGLDARPSVFSGHFQMVADVNAV